MISVIIPNYNHARYLKQRIDSVLNQTYQDFEVIILDDCSTDNSKEIIEHYRTHPKVTHIVYNENNSGSTFKQWNKGVAMARGEWIWMAESDDTAAATFLESLLSAVNCKRDIGIAFANSSIIDEGDQLISSYSKEFETWSSRWQQDYTNWGKDEVKRYLRFSPVILNASSCIFRKAHFVKAGGCDERFKLAGDWALYVKILAIGDIAYVATPLNYFRKHTQTVRNKTGKFTLFYEKIKVVGYIYQHFTISSKEKKQHVYSLLGELATLSCEITMAQKWEVLNYMQAHISKNALVFWWKLKGSLFFKSVSK